MEQLPYDNLDRLAEILQVVFTGTSATIKQANDILSAMARDPTRFVDSMMKIITNEKGDANIQKIKKAASITTLRLLSSFLENKKNPIEQKQYILESIITGIYSPHAPTTTKSSLQQVLSVIYHGDTTGAFKEQSLKFAKEKLEKGQINDYAGSLSLIYSIIESPMNSPEAVANWFQYLLEGYLNAGDAIIDEVGNEILAILKGEHEEQKIVNVFMGLEILKVWNDVMVEFIQKLSKSSKSNLENITKPDYIELIIDKERIGAILLKTLVLQIPTENQIKSCMFSTSGLKLDTLLNQIKYRTIKCFELILDSMIDAAKVGSKSRLLTATYNKLYSAIQTDGVKAILQSLMYLCKSNYAVMEKGLEDKAFHECLSQSVSILGKLTAFQELYSLFSDHKNMIIMDICLPLIACTKKDLAMFTQDPQSFVEVTLNLEEDQETHNVKLQALQLLRKICENIDGAPSCAVLLIIMLIEYSLHSNDLATIETTFPKLVDYKDTTILKEIEPRVRMETCLLVLTSIAECIHSRKDLLFVIDELFSKNHEYFLGPNLDPLIKTRMCLLLGSYISILFRREETKELYGQHLSFIIECVGITDPQQQTVAEQANETLYDMLAEKAHVMRMAPLIVEILAKFITYIKTTQCIRFFDVLHEVIRLYSSYIIQNSDLLLQLVDELRERGTAEYGFLLNDKGLSKMALTKIWNIIKVIGSNKTYLQKQNEIEERIIPMFMFIVTNESQPFDDELLDYLASTTKTTEHVSALGWELFQVLPTIFDRYQHLITPIFPALNHIIVYGKDNIEANIEMKQMLIDIGIKAMNTTHPDAGEAGISLGAVLLQILIQYVGIPHEELQKMLVACFEKIKTAEKKFLKARIGGVFLLALLRNFEFTQQCLIEMDALGIIMEMLTASEHVVMFNTHVYDRKIFLLCISKLFVQPNLNQIIIEKLPQLLDVLISFLSYVQMIEHRQALLGNKKNVNVEYDSEDEDENGLNGHKDVLISLLDNNTSALSLAKSRLDDVDDDDDDDDEDEDSDVSDDEDDDQDYFPTEKHEANYYVARLVSEVKNLDEFKEFRETINKMKENNTQLLQFLVTSLAERKKQLMKEVLQSQRVVVNPNESKPQAQARKMVRTAGRKVAQVNNQS